MGKSNIDEDLCARLKQTRIKQGYRSGRAFAMVHDIAVNTYLNHENGKRTLSLDVVKRYATLLNVSYIWLLTGEGVATLPTEEELSA